MSAEYSIDEQINRISREMDNFYRLSSNQYISPYTSPYTSHPCQMQRVSYPSPGNVRLASKVRPKMGRLLGMGSRAAALVVVVHIADAALRSCRPPTFEYGLAPRPFSRASRVWTYSRNSK